MTTVVISYPVDKFTIDTFLDTLHDIFFKGWSILYFV